MSSSVSQCRVALAVTMLAAAGVVPWIAAGPAAAGPSASFEPTVVSEQRGDVVNITVQTSKAGTVNIGSAENGFWMQVDVESGTTELRLNTYTAGRAGYDRSEMVWAAEGSIGDTRFPVGRIDGPMAVTDYHMNVTIDGAEHAIGRLSLEPRETSGIAAAIAPRATDPSAVDSLADFRDRTVVEPNASVARGDWLFVRVNASGLDGSLSRDRLDGSGDAGYRVKFAERDPEPNTAPNTFEGDEVEGVEQPSDAEGFILAIDTADHDIEAGETYEVSFVVPGDSPLADDREEVSTAVRIVERRVTVDRRGTGEAVVVENETSITGTTTLSPGTTINLTARDAGTDPFHQTRTVTVGPDGTFEASFDFAGLEPGREFEFRLPDQDRVVPGRVKSAETATTTTTRTTATTTATTESTTTEPTPTTTRTTAVETTAKGLTQVEAGATERPLSQQALRADNAAEDDSDGSIPGFGTVGAALALLGAVMLAARRA